MPLTAFKTEVNAPAATLWTMMREKMERPDKYVPGVQKVEIVQRFDEGSIERVMVAGGGDQAKTIHEIITADDRTMTVVFKLKDDPIYTGFVINTVFEDEGHVWLDYTMHWTPKDIGAQIEEPDFAEVVKESVLKAKAMAEERAG